MDFFRFLLCNLKTEKKISNVQKNQKEITSITSITATAAAKSMENEEKEDVDVKEEKISNKIQFQSTTKKIEERNWY